MCAPLNKGEMRITILEDGTIKTETGNMAGPAHQSADDFLTTIARLAGGTVTEESIGKGHTHSHGHSHEHGGQHHKH